ncbi:MAG: HD-GYP domain-containing protein [Bacteriovoracaceae bacterium]
MKKNNVFQIPDRDSATAIMGLVTVIEEMKSKKKKMVELTVKAILNALDQKDHYTFGHSMRVAYFSIVIGEQLGLDSDAMYDLELSALFHDIGKIGIPDSILNKPGRLEEEEFNIMKLHPVKSGEILEGFDGFEQIALNAKLHHERYDGRGYPDGMKGEAIPTYARIILIADTFDAMTSSRPYRKGLPYQVAYDELRQFAGTQFDPKLVELFIKGMNQEEEKAENVFYLPIMGKNFEKKAA